MIAKLGNDDKNNPPDPNFNIMPAVISGKLLQSKNTFSRISKNDTICSKDLSNVKSNQLNYLNPNMMARSLQSQRDFDISPTFPINGVILNRHHERDVYSFKIF